MLAERRQYLEALGQGACFRRLSVALHGMHVRHHVLSFLDPDRFLSFPAKPRVLVSLAQFAGGIVFGPSYTTNRGSAIRRLRIRQATEPINRIGPTVSRFLDGGAGWLFKEWEGATHQMFNLGI